MYSDRLDLIAWMACAWLRPRSYPTGAASPRRVHDFLSYWTTLILSPLASFVDSGSVLSLGSFSKILAPGLRLGWLQGRADRLQTLAQCGLLDSGGGLNPFTAAIVRSALELGLQQQHLDRLRQVYAGRLAALDAALQRNLAGRLEYRRPAGGFFIWARLVDGQDAEMLQQTAQSHGVGFRPGIRFSSQGGLRGWLRLCFAYYDEARLTEGAARLGQAIEQLMAR